MFYILWSILLHTYILCIICYELCAIMYCVLCIMYYVPWEHVLCSMSYVLCTMYCVLKILCIMYYVSPSTPSKNQYGYPSLPHTHPNQDKCSGISIPIWKDLREMLIATFKEWMAILIPTLEQCMEYSSTLLWNQQGWRPLPKGWVSSA